MAKIIVNNPRQVINGGAKKYYFKVKGLGGPKGDKGEKGDPGSRGPQGLPGNAATVYVGSTTTLPVGQDATVENVGTQYNAVLNFGIPQGPRGPQGVKGDPGEPGQKGEPGPRGVQGEKGTNATVYIGTTSTLNPGTQATVYNSGTENNAVLNFGIPRGEKGETGATGATGATGPAGQNFTPTIVDSLPATGNQSNLYLTPKNYTTGTATGNPITISLGEDAGQISSAQLDGNTTQLTYTGKNLYQSIAVTEPNFGIASEVLPDGRVRIYGKATSNSSNFLGYMATNLPAGTYTFSITGVLPFMLLLRSDDNQNHWVLNAGQTKVTQTISSTLNTIWVRGYQLVSGTDYDITIGIQLEAGSEASSFEPYVGGQASPNPDYPQTVQTVTGEQTITIASLNLFDGVFEFGNISTTTGADINADTMIRSKNYAVIEGGKSYTISVVGGGNVALRFYQSDGTFIGTGTTGQSPNTFTAPANAGRVRFIVTSNTNLSTKAQCEKGSTATDWTPYYEPYDYTLDLGSIELCKIGDYQDYIWKDDGEWKIHKNTNRFTFEQPQTVGLTKQPLGFVYNINNNPLLGKYIPLVGKCSHFDVEPTTTTWTALNKVGMNTVGALWFRTTDTNQGDSRTIEEFAQWLVDAGVSLVYALATPTDTTITDQTLIAQLEAIRTASLQNGTNTLTNTAAGSNLAGDMEIGYYWFNPRNRYDKWLWLDINNEYEQIGS